MRKNFISILITNYNKEKFLKKSLKSISNQTFKNYEVILYDDCSLDNSLKIIRKFKKIKLIRNLKRNKNKSKSYNQIKGIVKIFKKSKGNIICLMDSDDYFKKNKLAVINKYFLKNIKSNSVFNMPISDKKKFSHKNKKRSYSIWPTIFPTSCISLRKKLFLKFIKYLKHNEFQNLEIDARFMIFSKFFMNENNILNQKLTVYNEDVFGITSNIRKYSLIWWLRRGEAFQYLKYIITKKKKNLLLV